MYKSVILPLAKQDIRDAAKWYNERKPGLGKVFTAEVRQKVRFIQKNPKAAAIRYDNIRTSVLDIFPYMIHFEILAEHPGVLAEYSGIIADHSAVLAADSAIFAEQSGVIAGFLLWNY